MEPTEKVAALWEEVFGEPPAITADIDLLTRVLVQHLDAVPPYRPEAPVSSEVATPTSHTA